MTLRAYKTKLIVNNREDNILRQCAGKARFVFNWGLAEWKRQYTAGEKPSAYALKKHWNSIKDEQFPWVRGTPAVVEQEAFINLGRAFVNFFRRVKQGEKPGYPKFKSRQSRQAFRFIQSVTIEDNRIKLPRIGWLRLAEKGYLPDGKPRQSTVSLNAGVWYVSVLYDVDIEPVETTGETLGIDIGVKTAVVTSDGTFYENQHTLKKYEKKLARLQRELSRRKKRSQNWHKTKSKIARLHAKIGNTRNHTIHDITRDVTYGKRPSVVVLEDLSVSGMTAAAKPKPRENGSGYERSGRAQKAGLNRAILDVAPGELRRQVEYKASWAGIETVIADRYFPSSKKCSNCGHIKADLTLGDRVYMCQTCGISIDRDLNAAKNLAAYEYSERLMQPGLPVELGLSGRIHYETGNQ
jgi:putative transposase